MQRMSAHEAKARFGQLLDTARTEPVAIEKHGRPVAVLVSHEEYAAIQSMKLERLRAEVQRGMEALDRGPSTAHDEAGLERLADDLKAEARRRAAAK
ncbi:MAG: type II toxin-antitoxin system Phd/YefM family antitoxin [Candidatus Latescibacterota bacterium]